MSDEIKEINRIIINVKRKLQFSPERRIVELFSKDEIKILLDYITNLQENNKSLKGNCKVLGEKDNGQRKAINRYIREIEKLEEEKRRLKERVAYLERSNDRREDTIIGLRFEVAEQEDYKSRCEKAIEDIEFCFRSIKQEADMSKDERTRHEMRTCLAIFNETLKSLKKGSDKE